MPVSSRPRSGVVFTLALTLASALPACSSQAPAEPDTAPPVSAESNPPADEATMDFRLVQKLAEAGDAHAQLLLAEKWLTGVGTAADTAQGLLWLEKSAASNFPPALDLLASLHYRGVGYPENFPLARALMERAIAQQYLPAINNLAWLLATCPDASLRDGRKAIALLQPVLDQSPQMLDTLAAAYAETGDFVQAVTMQTLAIRALGSADDQRLPSFAERLRGYRNNQPWRDPPGR